MASVAQCHHTCMNGGSADYHIGNRDDSRFAPSQWETALLCNDVSHWLGTNLESPVDRMIIPVPLNFILEYIKSYLHCLQFSHPIMTHVSSIYFLWKIMACLSYKVNDMVANVMSWRHKSPGHLQLRYWQSPRNIMVSSSQGIKLRAYTLSITNLKS